MWGKSVGGLIFGESVGRLFFGVTKKMEMGENLEVGPRPEAAGTKCQQKNGVFFKIFMAIKILLPGGLIIFFNLLIYQKLAIV